MMKQIRQNQDYERSNEERILSLERIFDENDLTDSIAGLQRWIFNEFMPLHQKLDEIKGLMSVKPAEIVSQGVGSVGSAPEIDLLNETAIAYTVFQLLKELGLPYFIIPTLGDRAINYFYQLGRNDALSKPVEERTVYDWILIHNPGYKTAMLDSWRKGLAKPKSYSDSSGISGLDQEAEELMRQGAEWTREHPELNPDFSYLVWHGDLWSRILSNLFPDQEWDKVHPAKMGDSSGVLEISPEIEELMRWGAEVTKQYPEIGNVKLNPTRASDSSGIMGISPETEELMRWGEEVTRRYAGGPDRSDSSVTVGSSGGSGGRMGGLIQPAQPKLSLLDLGMLNLDALAEDPRYQVGEAEDEDDSASPSSESEPDAAPPQGVPQYAAVPFHRTPETALRDVWEHGEGILGEEEPEDDGRYDGLSGGQALQFQLIMDRLEELSKNVEKLLSDMEEMKEKRIYIENMNYMIDDGLVNDRIDMAQFNRDFGAFCTRMGYLKMNMN